MSSDQPRAERIGVLLAVLAAFGFSLKAIFVKLAYLSAPVDAITLLCLRMALALPVFIWMALRTARQGRALQRRDWLALVLLGFLGYYASSLFDFIGLQYISSGLERLILFTYPTLTVLIGVFFMGQELGRRRILALLLSYCGIALAFAHDVSFGGAAQAVFVGAGWVFLSALCYAAYSAAAEPLIRRVGSLRFAAIAMLVSTAATLAHFLITRAPTALVQPLPVYGYALGMALLSTVLPIFWLAAAIGRIGAARAVLIGSIGPVLTIFFGWWLLDEAFSLAQLAGAALVLGGVLLVGRSKAR